jgi:hypothetical protein
VLVWHSGNARECAYYFRPRELLLVEMFPKVVGLKDTWDDIEDVFPPGIRLAKQRLSTFFAWRLASVDKARAAAGGRQASGRPRVRYGQAGECSDAKLQRLTVQYPGEASFGQASRACRPLDLWLTSQMPVSSSCTSPRYSIVYLGRGSAPCQGRTRCVLNSAALVDALDSVGLLFASLLAAGSDEDESGPMGIGTPCRDRTGCVHMNLELSTHTFLETVDVMRQANMIIAVQGSQNYNVLFASSPAIFIEMVPFIESQTAGRERTAEIPENMFIGSLGFRTAILPIPGFGVQDTTPFAVEPCRLIRLIDRIGPLPNVTSPLERCSDFSTRNSRKEQDREIEACRNIQACFMKKDLT